jgi:hypothetical protein
MTDETRADWALWTDVPHTELWRAVALSLDYEPAKLPGLDARPIWGGRFDRCPAEFKRRLLIARAHLGNSLEPFTISMGNADGSSVRLDVFRVWGESLKHPWVFPEQFPRPALAPPSEAPSDALSTGESIPERNQRWAGLEVAELAANSSRGATTRVAKRISEAEGIPFETVKKGLQGGRARLSELTRQGKAPKVPSAPASVFELSRHSSKKRR